MGYSERKQFNEVLHIKDKNHLFIKGFDQIWEQLPCSCFLFLVNQVKQEVWATILALIWLHGFKMDAQEEWELLALKAVSWLRAQNGNNCNNKC